MNIFYKPYLPKALGMGVLWQCRRESNYTNNSKIPTRNLATYIFINKFQYFINWHKWLLTAPFMYSICSLMLVLYM